MSVDERQGQRSTYLGYEYSAKLMNCLDSMSRVSVARRLLLQIVAKRFKRESEREVGRVSSWVRVLEMCQKSDTCAKNFMAPDVGRNKPQQRSV